MMQDTNPPSIEPAQFERLCRDVGAGDTDFMRTLIGEYLSSAVALMEDMQDAARAKDANALERTAHTLKGSSAHVGAMRLRDHCIEIERRARQGALEEAERGVAAAGAEFERVERALNNMREEL